MKGRVFKAVVRPERMYGLETTALTQKKMREIEMAELKLQRFSLGVTRMDQMRKDHVRGTAKVSAKVRRK